MHVSKTENMFYLPLDKLELVSEGLLYANLLSGGCGESGDLTLRKGSRSTMELSIKKTKLNPEIKQNN